MDNVIKQLKETKVDAIYGKRKHFNAQTRKQNWYKKLSWLLIIISALASTSLLDTVFTNWLKCSTSIPLVLSVISTIIASIIKFEDYDKQSLGNAKVANMYLSISKNINYTISMIQDGCLSEEQILEQTKKILDDVNQANSLGAEFPTNKDDYNKAKEGIAHGEESYTDIEMKLWE